MQAMPLPEPSDAQRAVPHSRTHPVAHAATALALPLGAAWQMQQPQLWPPAWYAALLALAALAVFASIASGASRRRLLLLVVAFALAGFALTALRAHSRLAERIDAALDGRDLVIEGVVAALPRQSAEGLRFAFDIESASLDGRPVAAPDRAWLGWWRGFDGEALVVEPATVLRAGQRWRLPVRLRAPHGLANPHGHDFELWAFEQGIGATGSVRAGAQSPALLLDESAGRPVERARQRIRDAIEARVSDARAAGVLAALAVGDQAAIERVDWDLYRATGIAHLMSISGLHVTMFAWLAAAAIGAAWRRSARALRWWPALHAARWGGVIAAALYALLAGWGVPAQRTVWMLATAALLASLGLRWPPWAVLLAAAVVVCAIDPWALLQPGFWLSFAAVGLLFAAASRDETQAAPRDEREIDTPRRTWRTALREAGRSVLRTQLVATLGLAPLTLVLFSQLSLVGFIANLLAIPLITLLVTPLALLGVLVAPLWNLAATLVQALSQGLALLAGLPATVWTAPAAPWWAQAAGLLGGALAVMRLPWRLRVLALPLVLPLLWPVALRPADGAMQVLVADVGQGSAVAVRTRGHVLLHDAGAQFSRDSDAGSRVLVPLLRSLGWAPLDLLVLSHRDSDHVGGARALVDAGLVHAMSSSLEPTHALRGLHPAHTRCEAGQRWQWDGVRFEILHPEAADYATPARPNALSCVLAVTDAAGQRLLLTGDIEAEQEARLVQRHGATLASALLVVPHHGSRTSSTPAFLDAVAPRVALVQAGWRNRFGHPHATVLARYRERGIALARSDECGAWRWPAEGAPACQREAARRYWQHHVPRRAAPPHRVPLRPAGQPGRADGAPASARRQPARAHAVPPGGRAACACAALAARRLRQPRRRGRGRGRDARAAHRRAARSRAGRRQAAHRQPSRASTAARCAPRAAARAVPHGHALGRARRLAGPGRAPRPHGRQRARHRAGPQSPPAPRDRLQHPHGGGRAIARRDPAPVARLLPRQRLAAGAGAAPPGPCSALRLGLSDRARHPLARWLEGPCGTPRLVRAVPERRRLGRPRADLWRAGRRGPCRAGLRRRSGRRRAGRGPGR